VNANDLLQRALAAESLNRRPQLVGDHGERDALWEVRVGGGRPFRPESGGEFEAMSIALAIRNRLAVCALMLMLAPYGISVPTFVRAAQAEEPVRVKPYVQPGGNAAITVVRLDELATVSGVSSEPALGPLYHGGTVTLHDTLWTLRPSDGRAVRPYLRPYRPEQTNDK
jgi:hypothetical protein